MLAMDLQIPKPTDSLALSKALCLAVDEYGIPRKSIARTLGRSLSWVTLMERISRDLCESVKVMVADGFISTRSAEEIARLPVNGQERFAEKVFKLGLNKTQVRSLVSDYLSEDCDREKQEQILNDPLSVLQSGQGIGNTVTPEVRFARLLQRCITIVGELQKLSADVPASAIESARKALMYLSELIAWLLKRTVEGFDPGQKTEV